MPRISSDLMSSLQRITSASWLEQLYDTRELKQDDLTRQSFKLLQIAWPTYFNYSLLCSFFSRFVWLTYTLCWISHWFIASMKETPEENNGYVVYKWNIYEDQLGIGWGCWGRHYSACPHPFLQQAFGQKDDVDGFSSTSDICFMLAPLSCSIFLLLGKEMFKCISAGGRRLAYNFLQAIIYVPFSGLTNELLPLQIASVKCIYIIFGRAYQKHGT